MIGDLLSAPPHAIFQHIIATNIANVNCTNVASRTTSQRILSDTQDTRRGSSSVLIVKWYYVLTAIHNFTRLLIFIH